METCRGCIFGEYHVADGVSRIRSGSALAPRFPPRPKHQSQSQILGLRNRPVHLSRLTLSCREPHPPKEWPLALDPNQTNPIPTCHQHAYPSRGSRTMSHRRASPPKATFDSVAKATPSWATTMAGSLSCQATPGGTWNHHPQSKPPNSAETQTEPRDAFDLKPAKWQSAWVEGVKGALPEVARGPRRHGGVRFRHGNYLNFYARCRFTGSPYSTFSIRVLEQRFPKLSSSPWLDSI